MQFAIHVPQTIWLTDDVNDPDAAKTQINFSMNGADTSKCVMDIITPDGGTHHLLFHRGGGLLEQQFVPKEDDTIEPIAPLTPADYIVGGRDTRADNPYTHVAPIDMDTASRTAPPVTQSREDVEARKKAMEEAAANAKKAREEHAAELAKTPEQRAEDAAKREDELAAQRDKLLSETNPPVTTFTQPANPLIPPASSPLPGSPASQPIDNPNVGIVNRSDGSSINTEQRPPQPYNPNQGSAPPNPYPVNQQPPPPGGAPQR